MKTHWSPKVITDLNDPLAQSRNISLAEAQPWCNFVVLEPTRLPMWVETSSSVLRPECIPGRPEHLRSTRTPWSPANNSSIRTEFVTKTGAKFRLKQFLYDWARPAVDHPNLWKSEVRPYPLQNGHIVWIGHDYKKLLGASATMRRTSVELSVLEGNLTDEQIIELYETLKCVDEGFAHLIDNQPMAELSYWARYNPGLINVPAGLWQYHRKDPNEKYTWISTLKDVPHNIPFVEFQENVGYEFDSIGIFHSVRGIESEVIYTSPNKAKEIRAILQNGEQGRITTIREPHPATYEELKIGSMTVHLGYISEEFGPFDAVIDDSKSGIRALVMTSSAVRHSKNWFLDLISKLRFTKVKTVVTNF